MADEPYITYKKVGCFTTILSNSSKTLTLSVLYLQCANLVGLHSAQNNDGQGFVVQQET